MPIEGKILKTLPGTNKGAEQHSDIMIVPGDRVIVVASGEDWITVMRIHDGLVDTAPPDCFKYMNNKPVKL